MFGHSEDSYSAFVSWAKVGLYLGALVLLSTLFLFSGRVQVTDAIIYSDLDVDELVQQQRISAPYFTTQAESGVAITISAAYAQNLDDNSGLMANDLIALLENQSSGSIQIQAQQGIVQPSKQRVTLSDGITIEESSGISIAGQEATLDLISAELQSTQPIRATGPFGTFDAGAFSAQRSAEGYRLSFTGGIQLVYNPPEPR